MNPLLKQMFYIFVLLFGYVCVPLAHAPSWEQDFFKEQGNVF